MNKLISAFLFCFCIAVHEVTSFEIRHQENEIQLRKKRSLDFEKIGTDIVESFESIGNDIGEFFSDVGEFFESIFTFPYAKKVAEQTAQRQAALSRSVVHLTNTVEILNGRMSGVEESVNDVKETVNQNKESIKQLQQTVTKYHLEIKSLFTEKFEILDKQYANLERSIGELRNEVSKVAEQLKLHTGMVIFFKYTDYVNPVKTLQGMILSYLIHQARTLTDLQNMCKGYDAAKFITFLDEGQQSDTGFLSILLAHFGKEEKEVLSGENPVPIWHKTLSNYQVLKRMLVNDMTMAVLIDAQCSGIMRSNTSFSKNTVSDPVITDKYISICKKLDETEKPLRKRLMYYVDVGMDIAIQPYQKDRTLALAVLYKMLREKYFWINWHVYVDEYSKDNYLNDKRYQVYAERWDRIVAAGCLLEDVMPNWGGRNATTDIVFTVTGVDKKHECSCAELLESRSLCVGDPRKSWDELYKSG